MTIAEEIARRTLEMDYTSLDPTVLDQTRCLLLDYLGAAICGSQTESSRMVHRFLSANHAPSRGAPIIGTSLWAEAPYAALANGAASHALAHGGNLKAVSKLLGHTDPGITARVYQHVDFDMLKSAVEGLPDPFKQGIDQN